VRSGNPVRVLMVGSRDFSASFWGNEPQRQAAAEDDRCSQGGNREAEPLGSRAARFAVGFPGWVDTESHNPSSRAGVVERVVRGGLSGSSGRGSAGWQ
jgi:hypothetical protein